MIRSLFYTSILSFFFLTGCNAQNTKNDLVLGAARYYEYMPSIKDKKVGLLVNHTSMIGNVHLVDFLLEKGIKIEKIFAPEHGFRGMADAGEEISDNIDSKTGIRVVSIYGNSKKPSAEMMEGLEVVIFDIQDVGTRFYTYISSMHYMMEACAENQVKLLVLDRPNPNGHYVDGPVRKPGFESFVGMDPIPVV